MNDTLALARGIVATGFAEDAARVAAMAFGGYVLFARNGTSVEALRRCTDALRAAYGDLPPLIAIDQEGGRVARLREGIEPMPSMMALGATDDAELAERAGEQIAFDVRRAGCTIDFAPDLDLAIDARNTVIGTRSFGSDPQKVTRMGVAFAAGLTRGGILPCYKHFPGHGATATDSHEALPTLDASEGELRARDLLPFAAVAPDAAAIMGAHVLVTAIDSEKPATLSRRFATDVLRGELGFRGVYVTDCLEMNAISHEGSVEGALSALDAGADLLLFSHHPDLAIAAAVAIARGVDEGRIALARLEEAYARVTRLRRASASPLPVDAPSPHPGIGREIARRAITLVRGIAHADPTTSIAISFGQPDAPLQREAPALELAIASAEPSADAANEILATLERSERRPLVLARRAHMHPAQAAAIARIIDLHADAVVVSLLEPFDVPLFGGARHVLATYGDDAASIGALADVLFGNSMPRGQLPVALKEAHA